jgi:hypothetical protein
VFVDDDVVVVVVTQTFLVTESRTRQREVAHPLRVLVEQTSLSSEDTLAKNFYYLATILLCAKLMLLKLGFISGSLMRLRKDLAILVSGDGTVPRLRCTSIEIIDKIGVTNEKSVPGFNDDSSRW